MRVISLVPSWTQTLIEAGVQVVGRTRYCVHPADAVQNIPVVGGTKEVDWSRVGELRADLVLLDREENTRAMADACPLPWHATHVTSVDDPADELERLADRLACAPLRVFAMRWRTAVGWFRAGGAEEAEHASDGGVGFAWRSLLGVRAWVREPTLPVDRFLYLIWYKPWMAAGAGTFIHSVLELLGYGSSLAPLDGKYTEIDLNSYDPARTLLLAADEPYPFHEKREGLDALPHPCAIVDGANYSWFGLRTLRFIEGVIGEHDGEDSASA
jgi:iron complex transport system substrate-binding protein